MTPSRAPRTVELWALRAFAVLVVAVVGVASSGTAGAGAPLDASAFVRSSHGAHEIAALATPVSRVERSMAHVPHALAAHAHAPAFAPKLAPHVVVFHARALVLVARVHLHVVTARGPPVVVA